MPPVTRKVAANASAGVGKKAPARKPRSTRPRETSESWGFLDAENERDRDQAADADADAGMAMATLEDEFVATREPTDVDEAMNPLREMAERVGQEVEIFAEGLDQLLDRLPKDDQFEAVLGLVREFRELARDAAHQLEQSKQQERAQLLAKEWGEQAKLSTNAKPFSASATNKLSSRSGQRSGKAKLWRERRQEADIWELFDVMLSLHHNPEKNAIQQAKEDELARLGRPHRYTSENEIWEHFLLSDDLARERSLVKRWLEETVDHQESNLEGIVKELETRAGCSILWSSGWMNTREKIKGEKRLRSWPTSPGAPLPQIRNADNTELLVTTLDPDARSRQGRTLENEDMYSERAIWIACWEMLRRGESWEKVSKWCENNKEGWRALSIGKGSDTSQSVSNAAWRKMCYLASQSSCSNDYEAAVYGLLGGSVKAVNKVCRTVDDTLYAYYNASLLRQFDQYIAVNFPDRAPLSRRVNEDALQNPEEAIVSLIRQLREHSTTSMESVQPMKIIQSYLLANDVGSFIHTLGHSISHLDSQSETPAEIFVPLGQFWEGSGTLPEEEVALNPRTLRIANHMAIFLRVISGETLDGDARDAEENVAVAYIQTLRAAGKRDLIPLYASRLTPARATITMGRVLQDVTDHKEQQEILRLLEQYKLDNVQIINEQLRFMLERNIGEPIETPLKMLEYNTTPITYPGQCIANGFYPVEPQDEDDAVVRSLRWFVIIDKHWEETFSALSLALRKCLRTLFTPCR
jgi:nuclear pore complex protein Nup107